MIHQVAIPINNLIRAMESNFHSIRKIKMAIQKKFLKMIGKNTMKAQDYITIIKPSPRIKINILTNPTFNRLLGETEYYLNQVLLVRFRVRIIRNKTQKFSKEIKDLQTNRDKNQKGPSHRQGKMKIKEITSNN